MITPVILAGGTGTRLWPISRESNPKQFAGILGEESLFQNTVRRLSGSGFLRPVVLTRDDYRFIVTDQMGAIGSLPEKVFIEPFGRNTAPAILLAALYLAARDPDAVMLVAPSDHFIPNDATFRTVVQSAESAAKEGRIVTFGIKPDHPATGFGYLELEEQAVGDQPVPVASFVEKPDLAAAVQMLASGRYLWNSGLFLFSAQAILNAFEQHAPDLISPTEKALSGARIDLGFTRLDPEPWAQVADISIDYAIMEKVSNLSVVAYDNYWSDLGGWKAVWRESNPDSDGVSVSGQSIALECENSHLRSSDQGVALVGLGLKNIIAVAMSDAVLVADMSREQDVGRAVQALKAINMPQSERFATDHRPWGKFRVLVDMPRFKVKQITVHSGGVLSLQSHQHRSEHWVVVEGIARVTIGDDVMEIAENQSIYVPQGEKHRLENATSDSLVLIEVQTGSYFGEDDIVRCEDVYSRGGMTPIKHPQG